MTTDATTPQGGPELTVVIPAYNEAARLPATLDALEQFLDGWGIDYQVLVVNDGSRDATARLTADRGRRFSTHSLPHNRGKGAAVRAGMLQAHGEIAAFVDADLSCGLDCLRRGYDVLLAGGAEVVLGARNAAGSEVSFRRPWLRKVASAVFRGITHCLISSQVSDSQAGFKMFRRGASEQIFSRTTLDGFAFDVEVVFLLQWLRLPFAQVPVHLISEQASSLSLPRHTLPMLLDVLRIYLRAHSGWYAARPPASAASARAAASTRAAD